MHYEHATVFHIHEFTYLLRTQSWSWNTCLWHLWHLFCYFRTCLPWKPCVLSPNTILFFCFLFEFEFWAWILQSYFTLINTVIYCVLSSFFSLTKMIHVIQYMSLSFVNSRTMKYTQATKRSNDFNRHKNCSWPIYTSTVIKVWLTALN